MSYLEKSYYFITYWLTYLFTPWSRVLLENLTGSQLVKKFPAFYGTRRFITALTSDRHLSLSWASSIQSIPPHPTSRRYILILFSHLRLVLPSGLCPSGIPTKTLNTPLLSLIRTTCPTHLTLLYLIIRTKLYCIALSNFYTLLFIAEPQYLLCHARSELLNRYNTDKLRASKNLLRINNILCTC